MTALIERARGGRKRGRAAMLAAAGALAALGGCVSFGSEPPEQLFTLTPVASAEAGDMTEGDVEGALAVQVPIASQRLSVTRVPVQTSAATLAYLEDAVWVERPARLFRSLLAETIRARGNRLVIEGGELQYAAPTQLSGELVEMGYDVASSSATVRYDAVLQMPNGRLVTRRFESSESGVLAEAASVGPALNRAANAVAVDVADWVNSVAPRQATEQGG